MMDSLTKILDLIDEVFRDSERDEYVEFLEELLTDIEGKLEAEETSD